MLDNILKDRFLNLLYGTIMFSFTALLVIGLAVQFDFKAFGILMVGYFLGVGGAKWEDWCDRKYKELNS